MIRHGPTWRQAQSNEPAVPRLPGHKNAGTWPAQFGFAGPSPGGGTGRRAAFRMLCPYGRGGSSPLQGTVVLRIDCIWKFVAHSLSLRACKDYSGAAQGIKVVSLRRWGARTGTWALDASPDRQGSGHAGVRDPGMPILALRELGGEHARYANGGRTAIL